MKAKKNGVNRIQTAQITSNIVKIFQGVPKGLNFWPLLFMNCVIELPLNVNRLLVTQYADDIKISASDFSKCTIVQTVNTVLDTTIGELK